jgi:PAS domain S-box-containing protein
MKNTSRKLLAALAVYFILIAVFLFWHGSYSFRGWRSQASQKTGRLLFDQIRRREHDQWEEKKRIGVQTALIFTQLLAQPPKGTSPQREGQSPKGTDEAAPTQEPPRFLIGEGDAVLGIFAPGRSKMPDQAETIAAAHPQLHCYLASLSSFVLDTYFISHDNWLAVSPARRISDLPDDYAPVYDPLYAECAPDRNPGKEPRFLGPHLDDTLGRWVISMTVPVYLNGGFQGVIGHDIPVEQMFASAQSGPLADRACLLVLDDSFHVVFHRDLVPLFQKRGFDPGRSYDFKTAILDRRARQLIAALEKDKGLPDERLLQLDGAWELVLTAREPDTGWRYVFMPGASGAAAGARAADLGFSLLNVVFLLALTSLLFLFLRSSLVGPLVRIHDSLLLFQRTGSARVMRKRTPFFREIEGIFTSLEKVYAKLHEKIGETNEIHEYLEKLMLTSQSMVISLDARMRPTFVNEFGLQKFQVEREGIARLRFGDFFEREFVRDIASELKQGEYVVGKETTMTLRTGEKIDIALSLSKIRDLEGRISGYLAVIGDISKRKKAEIDLRNQILFSRQIFQSIPEMIIIVDRRLRVTFINKRARDLIPSGGASIIGQNLNFILTKSSIESGFDELVHNVLEGGNSVHRINTLSPVLEEESYVDLIVEPLKSGSHIIGGIIMLRDISEWRSLTAQLRSLQGFLQKLINASPYAVISINDHNLITTWNSAAEKILGISFANAFGQNLYALLPLFDKYKDIINEIMILKKTIYLNDEQVFIGEEDFKVANLTLYPVTAEQSGVVIHIEDVSALKKLESSLLQAQKMESLGLLTSHIIHDFNNLLSGIMGYASLLEKKIADNPKVKKYVSTIIHSSERASTLINQLLNFSRKKMAEKEIININDLIKESLDFLAMNLKVINLDIQLYRNQILLQADKTKISQILINLIINARDALENVPRPIIRIRTDLVEVSNQENLLDGHYALIEISDNGSGISPENQKKIFEPFFTTKGQGRGTGLGLAIVREIIHDYNGQIELESGLGRGTLFKILLPVFEEAISPSAAQERQEAQPPLEGLVLLIDDEEVVRDIGSDMLKALGLKCLTAANGTEGIELFKKNRDEVRMVILDIEMPGISGERVFHILRELRPDIPILIASGYGREYLEAEIFKSKIGNFIPKPFKIEQLSYQVNKLIGGRDV